MKCYDDIHQGQFHSIASLGSPFIFNNTCTSWREFSAQLIAGGCRAYIGTLWNVGNKVAYESACLFYDNAFKENTINAVNVMVNNIEDEGYKDIYVFCGLHFTTIKKMSSLSNREVINKIIVSLQKWIDYMNEKKSHELLRNTIRVIKFLCKELTPYYQYKNVMQLLIKSIRICKSYESKMNSKF